MTNWLQSLREKLNFIQACEVSVVDKQFIVQDREIGVWQLGEFPDEEQAKAFICELEKEDKEMGNYEPNFYAIK